MIMYRYKCVTEKGNNNSLQACFEDGDREQTVPKVILKFVVATLE